MSSSAANMSERGDIWLFRGFSVTCILSAFVGALTVGMLLGEPDVLMLFGAVGGVMVGAVLYVVNHRRYPPSVWPPMVQKFRQSARSSNAANMGERGDIWLSWGFSVTCILSAFIGF